MLTFFEWFAANVPPFLIFIIYTFWALAHVGRYYYAGHRYVGNGRYRYGSLAMAVGIMVFGSNYLWIQLGATPTLVQSGIFRFTALWMGLSGIHMNAAVFELWLARTKGKLHGNKYHSRHDWSR